MWSRIDTIPLKPQNHRITEVIIPIGFGVLTWLLGVLLLGSLVSGDIGLSSLLILFLYALLFLPLYRLQPWQPGLINRFITLLAIRRNVFGLAIGVLILFRLPTVTDPLGVIQTLLQFPLRLVPVAFQGATVFYRTQIDPHVGELLFAGGRLYVEFLWAYVLAIGLHRLAGKFSHITAYLPMEPERDA